MRKLLLASVAGLGVWGAVATDASAQTPVTPNLVGGSALPTATSPTPGTVVVRLNGRVRIYAGAAFDKDANANYSGGSGAKVQDYGIIEYGRLYPGFDGIAANGLKYGANLEIRQDTNYAAGGGANGSISGNDPKRAALYFRRVWGYLGTDQIGTVRLGAIDAPSSLFLTGTFENFNDGGWDGDANGFIAGNVQPLWPFAQENGGYYTTAKGVYLSPQIFGFDLGVAYEPNTANVSGVYNCNYAGNAPSTYPGTAFPAGTGCDGLSSTGVNSETARRRNTFDVVLRYRGSFGPVGVAVTGGFIGGSHVTDNSGLAFTNNPAATGGTRYNYDGASVGDFGATVTFAGLTVGGHYDTGRFNGGVTNLIPKGFSNSNAWIAGASYAIGPVIAGASYFIDSSAGDLGNAYFGRYRRELGAAAGATYSVAPGFSLFLSGLWGERKQNGYDFLTGAGVTAANAAGVSTHNKVTSSVVSIGTAFSW